MTRIIEILLAASLLFSSCTRHSEEDGTEMCGKLLFRAEEVQMEDDTKMDIGSSYHMEWRDGDQVGAFLTSTLSFLNTKAVYSEKEKGFVSMLSSSSGTLSVYYPYRTYASKSKNAGEVWISLSQLQKQEELGKCEAGKYLTLAGSAQNEEGKETRVVMHPLSSLLHFDIYDSGAGLSLEKVKRITVADEEGNALCGGYKYDLKADPIKMNVASQALVRRALVVELGKQSSVPSKKGEGGVWAAALPGMHRLSVTVETNLGSHLFTFSSPTEIREGHVYHFPLNLSSASENLRHYILYQPFDLMIWGSDDMYGAKEGRWGYSASAADVYPTAADTDPETPFAVPNTKYTYGSQSWTSAAGFSDDYFLSRGVSEYEYWITCEMYGAVKVGSKSNLGYLITPPLGGVKAGEMSLLEFDVSCKDEGTQLKISLVDGGQFTDGKTYALFTQESGSLPLSSTGEVRHIACIIENAVPSTRIRFETVGSKFRVNLDNLSVIGGTMPRADAPSGLSTVTDQGEMTASWTASSSAASYNWNIANSAGNVIRSGNTGIPKLTVKGLARGASYTFAVQSVPGSGGMLPSEYVSGDFRLTGDSAGGYVIFSDDMRWIDGRFPDYSSCGFDESSWMNLANNISVSQIPTLYTSAHGKEAWNISGYTSSLPDCTFAEYRQMCIGRAYTAKGHAGSLQFPDAALESLSSSQKVVLQLYMARKSSSDSGVLNVEISRGGVKETKKVTLRPQPSFYYDQIELSDISSSSRIRLYTEEQTAGVSNRVLLRGIAVYRSEAKDAPLENPCHVVAHRCAPAESTYPANSIAALHYCMHAGCSGIECDVAPTSDDNLIMAHPSSKGLYLGLCPWTHTYAQMYAAGTLANGERISTFEEFLKEVMIPGNRTVIIVDIKTLYNESGATQPDVSKKAAKLAVEVIRKLHAEKFCMLTVSSGLSVGSAALGYTSGTGIGVIMTGGGNTPSSLRSAGYVGGSVSLTTGMKGHGGTGARTVEEYRDASYPLYVYSLDKYYFNSASVYELPSTGYTDNSKENVDYYISCIDDITGVMSNYPRWLIDRTQ